MKGRIILHSTATELSAAEIDMVSGGLIKGEENMPDTPIEMPPFDFPIGTNLTGPQETKKVSSQDPNGPMDTDTSAADW